MLLPRITFSRELDLNINVGQNWSCAKVVDMRKSAQAILSDYLEKHIELDTLYLDAMFWKLLTFDKRFKDLGVFYKPAPIPDKDEWKASWFQEGKPNWLGTVPTRADDCSWNTAMIDGFLNEGGKGCYTVILLDSYARPKVAAIGYSLTGSLLFLELQGIRAALQLALDTGYGSNIRLTSPSRQVEDLFFHLSELEEFDIIPGCEHKYLNSNQGGDSHVCLACMGSHVLKHFIPEMEDFVVLYPIILEILELRNKFNCCKSVSRNLSQSSVYLGSCYGTTTTEEMKVFRYGKYEVHEKSLKPDKFPEKLEDLLYDDCFKGYRYYGQDILEEREAGPSRVLSAPSIFKEMAF